jgi:uncharacterized membrane protein
VSERWVSWMTIFTIVGVGVIAGIFFVFSAFIMQVLDDRPPTEAVTTMQAMNHRMENHGLFLTLFTATSLTAVVLAVYALVSMEGQARIWLIVGGVTYAVGGFLITAAYHIPRNEKMNEMDANAADVGTRWSDYLSEWLPAHHIRTVLAIVALFSFAMALRGD